MVGLRTILNCVGVTQPNVSVLAHFFGFSRGRVPTDPDTSVTAQVSLLDAVRGVRGRHVHLNVIRVGFDAITPATTRDQAVERLDYAVYKTRNVYRQVNLGVGRVEHFAVTASQANGMDDLGSQSEAQDLWRSFSVRNNGVDVFVVRTISASDFVGLSPVGGSCSKGSKDDGLVGGTISRGDDGVARTFAHEVGHFLGLSHNHSDGTGCTNCPSTNAGKSNLMAQTRCTTCTGGAGIRDSTLLTSSQGTTMRGHCSTRAGC
jgi:Metallo-peptidase family M12